MYVPCASAKSIKICDRKCTDSQVTSTIRETGRRKTFSCRSVSHRTRYQHHKRNTFFFLLLSPLYEPIMYLCDAFHIIMLHDVVHRDFRFDFVQCSDIFYWVCITHEYNYRRAIHYNISLCSVNARTYYILYYIKRC